MSAHFGATARDYEDVIARLHEHGVLEDELRDRLKGLGGFRNILVHDYLQLDRGRVTDHLERAPADFNAFAATVRRWLESLPGAET